MIPGNRLRNYWKATPFRPFRLTVVSGRTFDVRHPEVIDVGRNTFLLFLPATGPAQRPGLRTLEVSLLLVESVEYLDE